MWLQILGWTFVAIGVVTAISGFMAIPSSDWWSAEFLAFAIGGLVFGAAGLAMLKMPGWSTAGAILCAALLLVLLIGKSHLDRPSALLSYAVVAALADR